MTDSNELILITGATGYVGGRLLKKLESEDHRIRCMVRRPENLQGRIAGSTEVVQADGKHSDSLARALCGVHTAYYLIHAMGTNQNFEVEDRQIANNFAAAAKQAGVQRIIYLGGLGHEDEKLSQHLRSRHEVGRILRSSGAEVIEFRASIVIGSGSLSFDLVRTLTRKLPIMLWPKWVSTKASPIAIEDLLDYLTEVLEHGPGASRIYEIGGPEQVSYGEIMQEYARQRHLTRWAIPVPFLSPYISSLWLGLVTPVYARIGRKLIESLRNPTVVTNDLALKDFRVRPRGVAEAIERARLNEDEEIALTRWSDSLSSGGPIKNWGGTKFRNRLVDSRIRSVNVSAAQAFAPIQRIGGDTGWYWGNWLWHLRGFLDLMVGGVGLRRGRKHPVELSVGETLDFWRVEMFDPPHRLRLAAEMKLPGRAWLEFEVTEEGPKTSTIRQTAEFDPVGLFGLAYWYSIWPLHQFVFHGMLRNIAEAAESEC